MSHVNTDFDALASMFAAKKLYPNARVVVSDKQNIPVKQFLTIYRDTLDFTQDNLIDWAEVTEIILVDVASLSRVGQHIKKLNHENVTITVYDHHPRTDKNIEADKEVIEQVGATVTLLIEEIRERNIAITSFEATLFGLGIYTDTSSFTNQGTTVRDFAAARFLMEQGMNLEMVQRFSDQMLLPEQQEILNELFLESSFYTIDGLQIVVSSCQHDTFQSGLAILTEKLLEITGADAVLTVVGMKKHIYIVGRASSERITLLPVLKQWGGGGHEQAGSATVKKANRAAILDEVLNSIEKMIKPAITAREIMTSPVKTILPETTIEEAGQLMYRYGHSGYPIVEDEKLVGIITRRDLDKGNHHGLGHAPVKAYMTTNIIFIEPETTLEEIQKFIIEHNIGRLPVVENGKLIGIVTRTNVIEMLHKQTETEDVQELIVTNLQKEMEKQLPVEIYSILKDISKTALHMQVSVYLIGGIVRDIFLGEPNDDIDIVVEGNGINFANQLQADYGGEVIIHENFGTATWTHPSGLKIDVTTSRLEYYDRPASLPDVETSTLKEDLYRRDFTINAMAIYLNEDVFGQLVDPFRGQLDLREKRIKTLHNLSFVEDPTRIFRAVRFEIRFQFLMDKQTEQLALHSIEKVKDLSENRIIDEMKRLFMGHHPARTMQRLFELQFWQQFGVKDASKQASCTHAHRLDKLSEKYKTILNGWKPNWFTYFLIPFYDEGNIDLVNKFILTKKAAKLLQESIELKGLYNLEQIKRIGDLQRVLKNYSDEAILFFIAKLALENEQLMITYLQKRSNLQTYLTGEDLIKQGLKPSTYFSELLLELEVAVLNEEVTSKEAAMLWLQKQITK